MTIEATRWDEAVHPRIPHGKGGGRFTSRPGGGRKEGGPWSRSGDTVTYHGNLGINRGDMPQLSGLDADGVYHPSAEMVPKFITRLRAQGISVRQTRIRAASLKPTQTTGDMPAIRRIADSVKSGEMDDVKRITVSMDHHVLDGHHNWAGRLLADAEGGRPGLAHGMPVVQVGLAMPELIAQAEAFAAEHGIGKRKAGQFANPTHASRWAAWRPSLHPPLEAAAGIGRASAAGHHVPGTPYEWRHDWQPLSFGAAQAKFHHRVPQGWQPGDVRKRRGPGPGAGVAAGSHVPRRIAPRKGVSTPQEFHAKYLPAHRERLDKLKAEADRLGAEAAKQPGGGSGAERLKAYKAMGKYQAAVKAAVAKTTGGGKLSPGGGTVRPVSKQLPADVPGKMARPEGYRGVWQAGTVAKVTQRKMPSGNTHVTVQMSNGNKFSYLRGIGAPAPAKGDMITLDGVPMQPSGRKAFESNLGAARVKVVTPAAEIAKLKPGQEIVHDQGVHQGVKWERISRVPPSSRTPVRQLRLTYGGGVHTMLDSDSTDVLEKAAAEKQHVDSIPGKIAANDKAQNAAIAESARVMLGRDRARAQGNPLDNSEVLTAYKAAHGGKAPPTADYRRWAHDGVNAAELHSAWYQAALANKRAPAPSAPGWGQPKNPQTAGVLEQARQAQQDGSTVAARRLLEQADGLEGREGVAAGTGSRAVIESALMDLTRQEAGQRNSRGVVHGMALAHGQRTHLHESTGLSSNEISPAILGKDTNWEALRGAQSDLLAGDYAKADQALKAEVARLRAAHKTGIADRVEKARLKVAKAVASPKAALPPLNQVKRNPDGSLDVIDHTGKHYTVGYDPASGEVSVGDGKRTLTRKAPDAPGATTVARELAGELSGVDVKAARPGADRVGLAAGERWAVPPSLVDRLKAGDSAGLRQARQALARGDLETADAALAQVEASLDDPAIRDKVRALRGRIASTQASKRRGRLQAAIHGQYA